MSLLVKFLRRGGRPRRLASGGDLEVVLLGTGTPLPNRTRACASTLVLAGEKSFLVDAGRGFLNNFVDTGLADVAAAFFTHYHSDHFGEFGEFMVTRTLWGAREPLLVIGPPGARQTITSLLDAYRLDNSYRKAHHGSNWSEEGMAADIQERDPGAVYDEDGVTVTMFAVDHDPVSPAVGYRFTYKNRVVVVSGDTRKVPVMVEMAAGADILVHDVANAKIVDLIQRYVDPRWGVLARDVLKYHALTDEVAEIARDAKVRKLVLTHFTPALFSNRLFGALFTRGMKKIFKGKIIVGRDGMRIPS